MACQAARSAPRSLTQSTTWGICRREAMEAKWTTILKICLRQRRIDMTREELLSRISIDPNICFGKPCIRGHRIWVSLILDFLASGMTTQEILQEYPGLEEADILACIAYGAEMARERYIEIPLER